MGDLLEPLRADFARKLHVGPNFVTSVLGNEKRFSNFATSVLGNKKRFPWWVLTRFHSGNPSLFHIYKIGLPEWKCVTTHPRTCALAWTFLAKICKLRDIRCAGWVLTHFHSGNLILYIWSKIGSPQWKCVKAHPHTCASSERMSLNIGIHVSDNFDDHPPLPPTPYHSSMKLSP